MSLRSRLFVAVQHILPQRLLSVCLGKLANWRYKPLKNWVIRWFIRRYQVNMQIAVDSDINTYHSFNHFFTRQLKDGARPLPTTADAIASPADGCLSQFGAITNQQLIQAKGKYYSLDSLLAGQHDLSQTFTGGEFACFYLSPKDYHRVHLPIAGVLTDMIYVPGRLFSVNLLTAQHVDNLFGRNERVICLFNTAIGKMAVILVGAMIVGSTHTVWHGQVTPPHGKRIQHWQYHHHPELSFQRGDEIGHFQLGSTVIVLFEKQRMQWSSELRLEQTIQMGQTIGQQTGEQ